MDAQARVDHLEMRLALAEESLEEVYLSLSDDAANWQLWQRELSRNPELRKAVKFCFPRMGDWDCIYCHVLNFSRNDLCFVCGKRNVMADAEAREAWEAHPNDEGSQFRAQCKALAARQPEPDLAGDRPKSCAYYEWLQETGEGECLPNWTYYDRGGNSAGDAGGGGGGAVGGDKPVYASGAFGSWEQGLEEPRVWRWLGRLGRLRGRLGLGYLLAS